MCGIAGLLALDGRPVDRPQVRLSAMNHLQRHRGPDGVGVWVHERGHVGFGHRRLSIIDHTGGRQPMADQAGNHVTYNGEIYNYLELREELGVGQFRTTSDTEALLRCYRRHDEECVSHLRGMFAFAMWDEARQSLFCARDRFGIKPFYYTTVDGVLYFASEIKALLPFLPEVKPDPRALQDYLQFQFYLDGKTLFHGVQELLPGHVLVARGGRVETRRYWEVHYDLDWDHRPAWFEAEIDRRMRDSVNVHLRSDVPVGAYLSGGLDSSIIAALAAQGSPDGFRAYTGKFTDRPGFDESSYARDVAGKYEFPLDEINITSGDFIDSIHKIAYHMDQPVAGPGSFPQFMVSGLASQAHKVVLGGQGGDEIFGGYTRYLIAYFEQCIKGAIDGTMDDGNFVVSYESIIPNLRSLRSYKPLLKHFWRDGLFEDLDLRYYRLIDRAPQIGGEVRWDLFKDYAPLDSFRALFNSSNVGKESYFDLMTHFDFKTLLPALLHVEDRMSMAHSLESRVPFLDHPLIEFAATIPADVKFKDGTLKNLLRNTFRAELPASIVDRTDKMGFPVPLNDWMRADVGGFICDTFGSGAAQSREFIDNAMVLEKLSGETTFGRTIWGYLSLELWHQEFVDRQASFKKLLDCDWSTEVDRRPQTMRSAA